MGADDMSEYLRFATTAVDKDGEFLIPKSAGSIDKTCSGIIACIKIIWRAVRYGMGKSNKLEFFGLTPEQCKQVYFLQIAEPVSMTTLFTLSAICRGLRGVSTPHPVHQVLKEGGLATQIGNEFIDCAGVNRIARHMFDELHQMGVQLFGGLDINIENLLKGLIYISVDDSDSVVEASFSFNYSGEGGATTTTTSAILNKLLMEKIIAFKTKAELDAYVSDYIDFGKTIQACHGLLAPRRETENEAIVRRNGAGGLIRKMRFYSIFRDLSNAFPLCLLIRLKEKFSLHMDESVSVVHPHLQIFLMAYSCLREGFARGLEGSRHWKSKVPPECRSMLFIGHYLMRERKGVGAENTNMKVRLAIEHLNKHKEVLDETLSVFKVSTTRHFHNALLVRVQDKMKNIDGGSAAETRRSIAESGLQGHSANTGRGYVDSNLFKDASITINHSQMEDLVDLSKRMTDEIGLPFCPCLQWDSTTKVATIIKRIEFGTLGQALKFTKDDDLTAREEKASTFLLNNKKLLAMGLGRSSLDGLRNYPIRVDFTMDSRKSGSC
jgi:hypothetical protein